MSVSQYALAATYFVDGQAANDAGNGSQAQPKKFIASGMALLSSAGGDVLEIAPGNYAGTANAIGSTGSGAASAWNRIRARIDGTVIISAALTLPTQDHYRVFEGLRFESNTSKSVRGRYVKFLRCGFKGGPASGNTMNLAIGTNDVTPGAQYVLLEDVYAFGPGGRYNILVYNANKIVLRRVVVRHENGWSDPSGDPQANVSIYDSSEVLTQNLLLLDSRPTGYYEAALYHPSNGTTTNHSNLIRHQGAVILNIGGNGIAFDGSRASTNNSVSDSVVWGADYTSSINNAAHAGTLQNLTVGSASSGGINDWRGGGQFTLGRSILWQISGSNLSSINHAGNVCFNPVCSGETSLNPGTSGLRFLPRIENGSALASAGPGGTRVGATVLNRLGTPGSMYDEPGYDQVQSQALWPWPHESAIQAAMCAQAGVSSGFCAAPTLTRYVWEMLGNPIPASIYGAEVVFADRFE
jgi:hypothetical protein